MTKVFIGMPVYNGEKFIREALDSLVAQDFLDWELLIADNASTDSTAAICNEFAGKDRRISYIRHNVNQGIMFNFRYVLEQANHDYFMWAASDDIWEKGFLGECASLLDNDKKKSVAFCEILNIDTFGRTYRVIESFKPFSIMPSCKLMFRYVMAHEYFGKANIIYGLYRSNVIKEVMALPLDEKKTGIDYCINLGVLMRGGLALSEKMLFRKRSPRGTDKEGQVDFVMIDFKRSYKYENTDIVKYYLPNIFITLANTQYRNCLFLILPIRFIKIYISVFFNYLFKETVRNLAFIRRKL